MDARQFLGTVLPEQGPYLLAVPDSYVKDGKRKTFFRHYRHDDINNMAAAVDASAVSDPIHLYFALGNFKSLPPDLADFAGHPGVRTGDNVARLRCFWLDLDVKPDPKESEVRTSFLSQEIALEALVAFIHANGLPYPYLVSSGGGYHAYWPMTESIDVAQWCHYAELLKGLCYVAQLRADPSRTADCASVLRPVGSVNWKTGSPRPVVVVRTGDISPPAVLMGKIAAAAQAANLSLTAPAPKARTPELGLAGTSPAAAVPEAAAIAAAELDAVEALSDYTESDPKLVAERCQQIRWHATTRGAQATEPQWHDMVGCIRHCRSGAKAVHLLSSGYHGYTPEETDAKIDAHIAADIGATTCAKFELDRPGGCDGCPYRGQVKSPIVLGRTLRAAPQPVIALALESGAVQNYTLPDPPKPYKRAVNSATGQARIVMTTEDDAGKSFEVVIYDYDIYPVRRTFHQKDKKYVITLRSWLPQDGWLEVDVDQGVLLSDRRTAAKILGNAGVACEVSKIDYLVDYMLAYIRQLQEAARATMVYAQLGFNANHDRFILPDRIITPQGDIPYEPSPEIRNALPNWTAANAGSRQGWIDALKFFARPGFEAYQLMIAASFASPLFHFSGFVGGWLHLFGKAGSGKSLALAAASSVWGPLDALAGSLRDVRENPTDMGDTPKAFYGRMGTLQHLPIMVDEFTGIGPELAGSLAFNLTQGQGRSRLGPNGVALEAYNNFSLLLLSTANDAMHSKFVLDSDKSTAQALRIFEIAAPVGLVDKEEGTQVYYDLEANFGWAGAEFMSACIRDIPAVQQRVRELVKYFDSAAKVTSNDRFWSAYPAAALAALEVTNALGLTSFDLAALAQYCVMAILTMRGGMQDGSRSPVSVLDDFLRSNLRGTLIMSQANAVRQAPTDKLVIRVEEYSGTIYIDRAFIRRWLNEKGIHPNAEREMLAASGVLTNADIQVVLGRGSSIKSAQTRCWKIDANHSAMGGTAEPESLPGAPALKLVANS